MTRISVTVDGVRYSDDVEPRTLLVHYLREQLGKAGTVVGCDTSNCGACTVHLDGRSVKSCSRARRPGRRRTRSPRSRAWRPTAQLHPMQQAFHENHALQCGYCTPGHDHAVASTCCKDNPRPDRGRGPRRPRGQPVPLHRLPEHRRAVPSAAAEPRGPRDAGGAHDRRRGPPRPSRDRQAAPPQGGRAPDHRPHPLDRQHRRCPACCTSRWCAARSRTPGSPRIDTARGPRRHRRGRAS